MKKFVITIMILGTFIAKADLLKKGDYLMMVDKNGDMKSVGYYGNLVKADEVKIFSATLVVKGDYLMMVDNNGDLKPVGYYGNLVKADEVSK